MRAIKIKITYYYFWTNYLFLKNKNECYSSVDGAQHEVALHTVQGGHKLAGDDLSDVMSER